MQRLTRNLLTAAYCVAVLCACGGVDCPAYLQAEGQDCVALGDAGHGTRSAAESEADAAPSSAHIDPAIRDAETTSQLDGGTSAHRTDDFSMANAGGGQAGRTGSMAAAGSGGMSTAGNAGHGVNQTPVTDAGTISGAAICGNGIREGAELCDGADCKTTCRSENACVLNQLEGTAAGCDAHCITVMEIVQCASGDDCCPQGCSHATDSDCSPSCGDGVVSGNEKCEEHSPEHPCPSASDCDDGDVCTVDKISGSAMQCSAECAHMRTMRMAVVCDDGDPCTDEMTVESLTACTYECVSSQARKPTGSCADNDPCTDDTPVMSSTRCEYECPHKQQQRTGPGSCDDDDPCTSDERVTSTERCTYDCKHTRQSRSGSSSCDDANPCTVDSRVESRTSCSFECQHTPSEGQSCAGPFQGMKCNSKGQCELPARGLCGNGFLDDGESCDNTSMQDCPSCNDTNPCTVDSFTGSPETCNMVCQHMPIQGC